MCLYLSVNKVTKTCLPLQNDECLYKNFIISTISFFGHNYFTTNEVSFYLLDEVSFYLLDSVFLLALILQLSP